MSIPVSTVPVALAAVFSQTQTQIASDVPPSGEPILLTYGLDEDMYQPPDIIKIGTSVRRTVKPEVFIGSYQAQALRESYTIECEVSSWSGSADPLASIQRAYVLAGYIETAVRTDPSLGSTIIDAYPSGTSGGNPEWTSDPVGRLDTLTVSIDVITLN